MKKRAKITVVDCNHVNDKPGYTWFMAGNSQIVFGPHSLRGIAKAVYEKTGCTRITIDLRLNGDDG